MDGYGWAQEPARGRIEWNDSPRHIVAKGCPRKTVRPSNLPFSGLGLAPVPVIADENLICCADNVNSVRITQPGRRPLNEPQRLLILLERSVIDADPLHVFRRDEQFIVLHIQKNSSAGTGH